MQLTGKLRRHLCDTPGQRRESALLYYSDTVDIVPITGYEGRSWKIPADAKKPEDGRYKTAESFPAVIDRKKIELDSRRPLTVGEVERLTEEFVVEKDIYAVARSYSADDVPFWADDEKDTYRIYHLTYSHKEDKFLRFVEMENIEKVKEFLERQFIDEYL